MQLPVFFTAIDEDNNATWWRWLNKETPFDPYLIALLSARDKLKQQLKQSAAFQSLKEDMLFARTSISFVLYAITFGIVGLASSMFIVPLMAMSFFFSGLVILFSSLSYSSFKIASSKYNHTVLFLNRVLRGLADSIPPSVGVDESVKKNKTTLPSINLFFCFEYISSFFTKNSTKVPTENGPIDVQTGVVDATPAVAPDAPLPDGFEVHMIGPGAPVIYDDDPEMEHSESVVHLQNQPAEPINLAKVTGAPSPEENEAFKAELEVTDQG